MSTTVINFKGKTRSPYVIVATQNGIRSQLIVYNSHQPTELGRPVSPREYENDEPIVVLKFRRPENMRSLIKAMTDMYSITSKYRLFQQGRKAGQDELMSMAVRDLVGRNLQEIQQDAEDIEKAISSTKSKKRPTATTVKEPAKNGSGNDAAE